MLPYPVRPRQVYRDQAILPAVELPHPMPLVRVRVVVVEKSTKLYKLKVLEPAKGFKWLQKSCRFSKSEKN